MFFFIRFAMTSTIQINGMPWNLMGWNGTYVSHGDSVYRFEPHYLYGLIPILGVEICKNSQTNRWEFKRDCDMMPLFYNDQLTGSWGTFQVYGCTCNHSVFTPLLTAGFCVLAGVGLGQLSLK